MHGDLEDEAVLKALDLESVEDGGEIIGVELNLWAANGTSVSGRESHGITTVSWGARGGGRGERSGGTG